MRRIVTLKLDNGDSIHIVANTNSDSEAKQLAIDNCSRLLRDKRFEIRKNTPIVSSETWEKERRSTDWKNCKVFCTAFYMNNITQFLTVGAKSAKQAYIRIKDMYGIQENIFMLIYCANDYKKKSAKITARKAIKNNTAVLQIINATANKVKENNFSSYRDSLSNIAELILNASNGKYNYIDNNSLTNMLAVLIYFNDTVVYELDINNESKSMNDKQAVEYLINNTKTELKRYESWLKKNK